MTKRTFEPDGDKNISLWTSWLIRTLASEVRPDLGHATYRPRPSLAERLRATPSSTERLS